MTAHPRFLSALALLGAVLGLAACSGGPKLATGAPPAVVTAASEIDAIADLLDAGQKRAADKRLDAALKRDPMNPSLLVLRQGIDGDAKKDLGPASFAYVVKPGETMPALAQRFLGNRLKAYQLAQYNGIAVPASLVAGLTIRIPGEAPRPAPVTPAPRSTTPAIPRTTPPAAAPQGATNPAAAQRARSTGLAALNQGNVARAVTLLRRAAALDPDNAAIARDLARAERIAATVRSRR